VAVVAQRVRRNVAVLCSGTLFVIGACSSDKGSGGTKASTTQGSSSATAPASRPASSSAPAGAGGAADLNCPLTVDQVSQVAGEPMQLGSTVSCRFTAKSGKLEPLVTYVKQQALLIEDDLAAEDGFKERLPGVGDRAYIATEADGSAVLARVGANGFEVRIDITNAAAERAAAINLAKLVVTAIS
jgi:hypothetical protein